jgi:hypothetical protein
LPKGSGSTMNDDDDGRKMQDEKINNKWNHRVENRKE